MADELSKQFLIRPVSVGDLFGFKQKDWYFEVHQVGNGATAIYWLGNPPAPIPTPDTFKGNGALAKTNKPHAVAELECTAYLRSKGLKTGAETRLLLMLPSDPVWVPLRTHLALPGQPNVTQSFSATFKLIKVTR